MARITGLDPATVGAEVVDKTAKLQAAIDAESVAFRIFADAKDEHERLRYARHEAERDLQEYLQDMREAMGRAVAHA